MPLTYQPERLRRVSDAREFGRVAVLYGGDSSEREISLLSGNAVLEALKARAVDAHAFDPRDEPLSDLLVARLDRAARPGRRGRDGPGRARVPGHPLHRQRRDGLGHRHG
jgi:D-alanine-D-alanine ligase